MHEIKNIPVVDLLLDEENARLGTRQDSQQAVYLTMAKQLKGQLVALAQDIVDHGLDPTALTAVVATEAGRYRVLEGNRRALALKALDTPSIVRGGLTPSEQKKLAAFAKPYAENPVEEVPCVVFDVEEDAYHWIVIRHTGAHGGAGLVSWDANEADRFKARKGSGSRDPAGQVIDFLERIDGAADSKGIISSTKRVLNNQAARDAFGLTRVGGQLQSLYPAQEVAKGLRKLVSDLRSGEIKTKDVYEAADIRNYVAGFAKDDLPDPATKSSTLVALTELPAATATAGSKPKPKPKPKRPRTTLIPRDCKINAPAGRLNAVYNELLGANVDQFPNICAVALRVFVELSIDHEIARRPQLKGKTAPNTTLAKRLKELADDMKAAGEIDDDLRRAVVKIADGKGPVAASTMTFNQYVHNPYVHPVPSELRTAWDELQPFMERVLA